MTSKPVRASEAAIYLTASQVDKAIRKHFTKTGNVVLSQVRNGVGFARSARTADMLSVSTWPSRGLYCEGIEIKVSRSDLMNELAHPAKAEELAQYCSYWWVAGPRGLLGDSIVLPDSWGFIEVSEKLQARVLIPAKQLNPKPMDALLVCAIVRAFSVSHIHVDDVEPRIKEATDKAKKEAESRATYDVKRLREAVEEFEKHSGVSLHDETGRFHWGIGGIGEVVKLVAAMRHRPIEEVVNARAALQTSMDAMDACLQAFSARSEIT